MAVNELTLISAVRYAKNYMLI